MPTLRSLRGLLLVCGLIQLLIALALLWQSPQYLLGGSSISWGLVCTFILTGIGLLATEPQ